MSQEAPKSTLLNERVFLAISYMLVTLMFLCGVLTFGNLMNLFMPGWPKTVVAIVCALIVLDRLYTYRKMKFFSVFSLEGLLAITAQWIVIILVLKVVIGVTNGLSAFYQEIPLWVSNFQEYFFTPVFSLSLGIAVVLWVLGGHFAELLNEMSIEQALIDRQSVSGPVGTVPPRERLLGLVFNIGAFLFVVTALTRIDLRVVFTGADAPLLIHIPALEGGGASTLMYFVFGFMLLSLTQFASLNTRWALQGVRVERKLAGGWALYSLLFLFVLALIASLLPTSYSQRALAFLGYGLDILLTYVLFLSQLAITLFIILVSLPFRLMGWGSPGENLDLTTPEFPNIPNQATGTVPPIPWLEALKNILIWGTLIAIIIYAIRQYLRQHQDLVNSLRRRPILRWLLWVWNWLSNLFGGIRQGVADALTTGLERIRARRAGRKESGWGGFINPRRLDPRQQVYFFYQALIRRGNESGLARGLSQTPYEYASTLEEALPDVDEDVDAMTEAFVEARYTPRVVEEQKAGLVRTYWERIRRALRSRRDTDEKADRKA